MKVDDLELSVRCINALRNHKPNMSVEELATLYKQGKLQAIRNLGPRSVREIKDVIDALSDRDYKQLEEDLHEERKRKIVNWCMQHQALVMALMKGQAVIVPTTYTNKR